MSAPFDKFVVTTIQDSTVDYNVRISRFSVTRKMKDEEIDQAWMVQAHRDTILFIEDAINEKLQREGKP